MQIQGQGLYLFSMADRKIHVHQNMIYYFFGFHINSIVLYITKTGLFKYIENFTSKNENFQIKNADIFHIPAQNIDYGYSLEPPR